MPTYDYRCEHCGHEFSQIQRFTEGALEVCPNCGKRPTRLMSLPSIVFKGSGWYKTDSRRSSASEGSSSSSSSSDKSTISGKSEKTKSESGKGDTKGDATADTKSETKSETKKDKPAGSGGAATSGGSGGTST